MIAPGLGMRFLRGAGRRGLVRLLLMVTGTAIGVACLLVALAFPSITCTLAKAEWRPELRMAPSPAIKVSDGSIM